MRNIFNLLMIFWLMLIVTNSTSAQSVNLSSQFEYIRVIEWSPDGSLLAVGGHPYQCEADDPAIYILDGLTGQEVIALISASGCRPDAFTWSPDGMMIAASFSIFDTVIQTWHVQSGQILSTFSSSSQGITYLAWNPQTDNIAYAGVDSRLGFFDPLTGTKLFTETAFGGTSIDWSPDGEYLVSVQGGFDMGERFIYLNDLSDLSFTELISFQSNVMDVDWSPDGSKLVAGTEGGDLLVWDMVQNQTVWLHTDANNTPIWNVKWSHDNTQVMRMTGTGDGDFVLHIIDVATETEVNSFSLNGIVLDFDWSPDGTKFAYGGREGIVYIVLAPGSEPLSTETSSASGWK